MKPLENRFNTIRQGRISARRESRQQLVLRNNLEKRFYKQLSTLFRKFLNTQLYLYKEFGLYESSIAEQRLNEDFMPLMRSHYKRIFKAMYDYNENKYYNKKQEAFVFGRSVDFEQVVNTYFSTRQLVLTGITARMATRISDLIEQGRADNLNLAQITKLVSDKFLPISRSRAALIARTETHNAASFANHEYHITAQKDLGIKMLKKWVATNDARTRSAHSIANGQTVDIDEKFIIGGVEMGFAGDSVGGAKNVINCRCVIIYADEQDVVLD
jgi:uncharacterized protein with gpF-like domain|tara:strand:+ start:1259 stop:2074 length:816 start_codon:yes stop_codon:yes gene_type:complete